MNKFQTFRLLNFINKNNEIVYYPLLDTNPKGIQPNFISIFLFDGFGNHFFKKYNTTYLILKEHLNQIDITKLKTLDEFVNFCNNLKLKYPGDGL
jgi:hypothetical protein